MTTYTSPRHISVTDTAKLVRKALKANFPGIKFSVRSDSYSMGASIDIAWTDGPTTKAVDAVIDQYKGADFDGMQDMKVYRENFLNGEKVHFGADYIHTNRGLSVELVTAVAKAYCDRYGHEMPEIKVSYGHAYIDTWHPLRDEIMPLAYDCAGDELEGLTICISRGRFAIKRADTEEDHSISMEATPIEEEAEEVVEQAVQEVTSMCCTCGEVAVQVQGDECSECANAEPIIETPAQQIQHTFEIGQEVLITAGIYEGKTVVFLHLQEKNPIAWVRLEDESIYYIPVSMLQPLPPKAPIIDIQTRKPVQPAPIPQVQATRQSQVQKGTPVKIEVLDILKQGRTEGNLYYLPNIRLERKLYEAVNEVLERIGGKWNRKTKAHVFEDTDPAQLLELVFDSGEMPP